MPENQMKENLKTQQSTMEENPEKFAVAYIRVSTEEQADEGLSPEIQGDSIKMYAEENDLIIKATITEKKPASKVNSKEAASDFSITKVLKGRPEFRELLADLKKQRYRHLIVYSRDRIARDVGLFLAIKTYLGNDITIHYSKKGEKVDLDNAQYNRLFEIILAAFAELEANTISYRVKAGCKKCIDLGYLPGGKVPYGFDPEIKLFRKTERSRDKITIKPNAEKMDKVKLIYSLYTTYGYGYKRIAKIMNELCKTTDWSRGMVESILKNEVYTGFIVWDRRGGRRNPGKHDNYMKHMLDPNDNFLEPAAWENAVIMHEKKASVKDSKYFNSTYLLKGKLYCAKCGSPLVCRNNRGYMVYRCPTFEGSKSELIIKKSVIDKMIVENLPSMFQIESLNRMWKSYKKDHISYISMARNGYEEIKTKITDYNNKIEKLAKLKNKNLDITIVERIEALLVGYNKNLHALKEQYDHFKSMSDKTMMSKEKFHQKAANLLSNFEKLEVEQRRVFVDRLFERIVVDKQNDQVNILSIEPCISEFI